MRKTIGVTCDDYKAKKYRKRLLEKGFEIVHDEPLLKGVNVHLFKVEVDEDDFLEMKVKLEEVLKELEIEIKNSN